MLIFLLRYVWWDAAYTSVSNIMSIKILLRNAFLILVWWIGPSATVVSDVLWWLLGPELELFGLMFVLILFSFHLPVGHFLAFEQVDILVWMVVQNHFFFIHVSWIRVIVLLILISIQHVLLIVAHFARLKLVHLVLPIISCNFSNLNIFLILRMIFMVHVASILDDFIFLGLW